MYPISEWTVFTDTQTKVTIIKIKYIPDYSTFDHPIFHFICRAINNLCCSRMRTRTFHPFKIHCSVDSLNFLSVKPTKCTCDIHNSAVCYHSDMFRHCCVILPEQMHDVTQKYLILQKPRDQQKRISRARNLPFFQEL